MGKEQFPKGMEVKVGRENCADKAESTGQRNLTDLWSWEGPVLESAVRMKMSFLCFWKGLMPERYKEEKARISGLFFTSASRLGMGRQERVPKWLLVQVNNSWATPGQIILSGVGGLLPQRQVLAKITSDDGNFSTLAGTGTGGTSVWVDSWLTFLKNSFYNFISPFH